MNAFMLRSLLALSLASVAVGCGSSGADDGTPDDGKTDRTSFAVVAPAAGAFEKASESATPVSGFSFANLGTEAITVTDIGRGRSGRLGEAEGREPLLGVCRT